MKPLLICSCLVLGLSSCKKDSEAPAGVLVRVRNGSAYPFTALVVNTSGGENSYGALGPGQSSAYAPFSRAYRNAFVQATVHDAAVSFTPDDYVGEKELKPGGRYTYVVEVANQANGTPRYLLVRLETP